MANKKFGKDINSFIICFQLKNNASTVMSWDPIGNRLAGASGGQDEAPPPIPPRASSLQQSAHNLGKLEDLKVKVSNGAKIRNRYN